MRRLDTSGLIVFANAHPLLVGVGGGAFALLWAVLIGAFLLDLKRYPLRSTMDRRRYSVRRVRQPIARSSRYASRR